MALKRKDFVVLDMHFSPSLSSFKSHYEKQYMHLPGYNGMVGAMAAGLASQGYLVMILGGQQEELPDSTVNVKWLSEGENVSWGDFDKQLEEFGPGLVLIPKED